MGKPYFYFLIILTFFNYVKVDGQNISISTNCNTIYVGIDNHITILMDNFPCEELTVKLSEGTIKKEDNCSYSLTCSSKNDIQIYIYIRDSLIQTKSLVSKFIPDRYFTLNGISNNSTIQKKTLLNNLELSYVPDFICSSSPIPKLESLDIYYIANEQLFKLGDIHLDENTLPDTIKKEIQNLPDSGLIILDNIKVRFADGSLRKLPHLKYFIRNNFTECDYFQNGSYKIDSFESAYYKNCIFNQEQKGNCSITTQYCNNCIIKRIEKYQIDTFHYHIKYYSPINVLLKEYYVRTNWYVYEIDQNSKIVIDSSQKIIDQNLGAYIEYHPNGRIKIRGNYSESYNTENYGIIHPDDPFHTVERLTLKKECSKKDGNWKYYSPKGKIIKIEKYKLGELISTKEYGKPKKGNKIILNSDS